jgi:DNA-binding NarL/FixJ family response regulator
MLQPGRPTENASSPKAPAGTSVLLAEADKLSSLVLRSMLDNDERFRVLDNVSSGEELISYDGEPDLLLVDLTLPGLNAHDAIERFGPSHPACTIVVLAPADAQYLRHAMKAAGADEYVVLTTPDERLLDRLARLVSHAKPKIYAGKFPLCPPTL